VFSGKRFSRYNREYERCVTEQIPVHLGREREYEREKNYGEIQMWEREYRKRGVGNRKKNSIFRFLLELYFFFRYNCIQESETL
jgi:hypothetical protein